MVDMIQLPSHLSLHARNEPSRSSRHSYLIPMPIFGPMQHFSLVTGKVKGIKPATINSASFYFVLYAKNTPKAHFSNVTSTFLVFSSLESSVQHGLFQYILPLFYIWHRRKYSRPRTLSSLSCLLDTLLKTQNDQPGSFHPSVDRVMATSTFDFSYAIPRYAVTRIESSAYASSSHLFTISTSRIHLERCITVTGIKPVHVKPPLFDP